MQDITGPRVLLTPPRTANRAGRYAACAANAAPRTCIDCTCRGVASANLLAAKVSCRCRVVTALARLRLLHALPRELVDARTRKPRLEYLPVDELTTDVLFR